MVRHLVSQPRSWLTESQIKFLKDNGYYQESEQHLIISLSNKPKMDQKQREAKFQVEATPPQEGEKEHKL